MAAQVQWNLSGDYFENCNCSVVCPCVVSPSAPLTSRPTEGVCDLAVIVHIDRGLYGEVVLDGLNVALAAHWPGPMADGNGTVAAYIDQRANDKQTEALGAIFTGRGRRTDGIIRADNFQEPWREKSTDHVQSRR
jgi:hypothetical protein